MMTIDRATTQLNHDKSRFLFNYVWPLRYVKAVFEYNIEQFSSPPFPLFSEARSKIFSLSQLHYHMTQEVGILFCEIKQPL